VPVDPRNLRYGRLGMAMVSAAGPASNFGVALITAVAAQLLLNADVAISPIWFAFLQALVALNIGLCAFNLIPVAPLDGFGVAVGVLPWPIARPLARLAQYGPGILMLLVFSAYVIHVDLLGLILSPFRAVLIAALRAVVRLV
jgi:Zn-dependent protease